MMSLDLYVVVLVHLGLVPAVGYPLAWLVRGTFDAREPVGLALMAKAVSLALLFIVSVLAVYVYATWLLWVYAAVVTLVTVSLWWQFVTILRVLQRKGRSRT